MSWQKCPVCLGARPLTGTLPCPVCFGQMIINEITGKPPAPAETQPHLQYTCTVFNCQICKTAQTYGV